MEQVNKTILEVMKLNNGVLRTSDLDGYLISPKKMQRMVQNGEIERIENCLYLHPDFLEDEYFITSYRVPKGVFSYESALYLQGLSDENPSSLTLTIPSGWNSRLLKNRERYTFYYLNYELWKLGQEKIKTPYGNEVIVYSKERTLAEMIAKLDKMDRDLVLSTLQFGLKNNVLDRVKLIQFAEKFKSKEKIKTYLEVI